MDGKKKIKIARWIKKQCACALLAVLCVQGTFPVQAAQAMSPQKATEGIEVSGKASKATEGIEVSGKASKPMGEAGVSVKAPKPTGEAGVSVKAPKPTEGAGVSGKPQKPTEGAGVSGEPQNPPVGEGAFGTPQKATEGARPSGKPQKPTEGAGVSGEPQNPPVGEGAFGTPQKATEGAGTSGNPQKTSEGAGTSGKSKDLAIDASTMQEEKGVEPSGKESLAADAAGGTGIVIKLSLNKDSLTIRIGKSKRLKAIINPAQAMGQKVSWSSSNKKVAKVKNGKVIGISAGKVTVTAEAGGKKASCRVKVTLGKKAKKAIHAYQKYLGQKWIPWSGSTYKNQYQQNGPYRQDKFKFALADINGDGVPELFLANGGSPARFEGYEAVFRYSKGEVHELVRNDKIKCYYPKTGYVVAQYFGMGYHSFYYKIAKDGTVSQVGSEDMQVTGAPKEDYWFWDKREVTKKEFYQLVERDAGNKPVRINSSDYYENTAANRRNMAKLYLASR